MWFFCTGTRLIYCFTPAPREPAHARPFATGPPDPAELRIWLLGIVRMNEAAKLRSVHVETLKKQLAAEGRAVVALGKRARGIPRWVALSLPNPLLGGR